MHIPESVLENETHKFLWDLEKHKNFQKRRELANFADFGDFATRENTE